LPPFCDHNLWSGTPGYGLSNCCPLPEGDDTTTLGVIESVGFAVWRGGNGDGRKRSIVSGDDVEFKAEAFSHVSILHPLRC